HEDVGALVVLAVAAADLRKRGFEGHHVTHRRACPGGDGGAEGAGGDVTTRIPPERRSGGGSSSAKASTSSIVSTSLISSNFCTSSGKSIRSFLLRAGTSTDVTPARAAAVSFSFKPPMGSTLPRRVSSPVIATSWRAGLRHNSDASAAA